MEVNEYQDYLRDIMSEVGMINAEYSDAFWEPVRVIVGENYPRALAAMQLYDLLLVNPIADGMNLVAKEGALVNQKNGVIALSEHAGAFYELGDHALNVSPFDTFGTANIMHQALTMPPEERRTRAEALREIVHHADIRPWFFHQVKDALTALESHSSNSSTPATPETLISEFSKTNSGVPSERTPTPNA
jgi:trehalose 6-phosphate synthase